MKIKDKHRKLEGQLTIRAVDIRGNVLFEQQSKNLIVDTGYNATARSLAGEVEASIARIAIGTNGTPPAPEDTEITNQLSFSTAIELHTDKILRFHFQIGNNDANGRTIREFGLLTQDGTLFSRLTQNERGEPYEIIKSRSFALRGYWEIRI